MDAGAVELVLRAAAVIAAIALIFTKGVLPVFRFFKALDDGVSFVKAQMENNGGSSVKDAIDRTEAVVTHLSERMTSVEGRMDLIEEIHRKQQQIDELVAQNAAKLATRPHLPPRSA